MKVNIRHRWWKLLLGGLILFIGILYICLPDPLFEDPYSTLLEDKDGHLLGAKISADEQWRFPEIDSLPNSWIKAITSYEDKRFFAHFGLDPISLVRAIRDNLSQGRVVSGASTISMQVLRLSRKNKKRNFYNKVIETLLALSLEMHYSKEEILNLYASHAPFGGNVVGLEAASWRYFHKAPEQLSLAESSCLAVLPNAPGLIHPGRNRSDLLRKRNDLLRQMVEADKISTESYELALLEPIPDQPYPLPRIAPHYLTYVSQVNTTQTRWTSTIDIQIQSRINRIGQQHYLVNQVQDIQNLAAIVLETKTGNVISYLGNTPAGSEEVHVDMGRARRSSGSVLKPFLYGHLLEDGYILPSTLIADIPTQIQGYQPKNYNRSYSGAVPADEALAKSLNIPATLQLQEYGIAPFLNRLKEYGISTLDRGAEDYGLSLILGGGEVTLLELAQAYASLGKTLLDSTQQALSPGVAYLTLEALTQLSRPLTEGGWEHYNSTRKIAWKTGTSYGHRDAWAIGVTPEYTIAVWVGNSDGEGRNGLVGVHKAGPLLFDILNSLPPTTWFTPPYDDLETGYTCSVSGHLSTKACTTIDTVLLPRSYQKTTPCPYHQTVYIDRDGYVANSHCTPTFEMEPRSYFQLPPVQAYYYKRNHPSYQRIPDVNPQCKSSQLDNNSKPLAFIYPNDNNEIYLPRDQDGLKEKVIFKATHQDEKGILHWHLDDIYLGYTETFHTMDITAARGSHKVLIIDQWGNEDERDFTIIN